MKDFSHLISLIMILSGMFIRKLGRIDKDGVQSLLLAGHWMSPVIFYNRGENLKSKSCRMQPPVSSLKGWWNSIHCADLDRDGLPDILARK
ncbi:MAG: VCBS repeat-containing protein [Saprospiraceae bacterium]|nr:VCBS repeat-containing protein [Saprospiraceae bacterium]